MIQIFPRFPYILTDFSILGGVELLVALEALPEEPPGPGEEEGGRVERGRDLVIRILKNRVLKIKREEKEEELGEQLNH